MTAQYYSNIDEVIMVPDDDEDDDFGPRERPPLYSTLPRPGKKRRDLEESPRELESPEPTTLSRTARQEKSEKKRLRKIFRSFDKNHDGFLEKREVKNLITSNPDEFEDMNKALSKAVLTMRSTSRMSFQQFLNLIEDHEFFEADDFVGQISKAIIAPRDDSESDTKPKGFTFYVPIMVVFSIIQITCFLHDFITWNVDKNVTTEEGNVHFDGSFDYLNGMWAKKLKVGINSTEYYRYITYQFTHSDNMHIFGNILIQLLLGIPLEFMHGSWRLTVVYLAGVLSGSVGHVNFENSFLGGASGGVYAMLTAHIASVLMNWKAMRFAVIHLLLISAYIANSAYSGYKDHQDQQKRKPSEGGSTIGNIAHLGGAFAGLLVGIGMLRNYNSSCRKRVLWIFCVTVYCSTMIYGMLSIHCRHNPTTDSEHFCNNYQKDLIGVAEIAKDFTNSSISNVKRFFKNDNNLTLSGNCTTESNAVLCNLNQKY